jgi:hypothetical protein
VWHYPDLEPIILPDETFYRVLEDRIPLSRPAKIVDFDRLTIPVAERGGVTASAFDATASGYAARVLQVGGLAATLRPPPASGGLATSWEQIVERQPKQFHGDSRCLYKDREAFSGWSEEARLTDLQAGARASGFETDSLTKADLQAPIARCAPAQPFLQMIREAQTIDDQADDAVGGAWTWEDHFHRVGCTGDEGARRADPSDTADAQASVSCSQSAGKVAAAASGALRITDLRIADGWSQVVVERDLDKGGVRARSEALARGIRIGETDTIARVHTVAEVWSAGRPVPASERTSFQREVCGVRSPSLTVERCLTPEELRRYLADLNSRFNGRGQNIEVTAPDPDREHARGSPGGYVAGITKSRDDAIDAQLLDHDYQLEVPGLQIKIYKDSIESGPGRQIIQLAAVRGVVSYGILCLSPHIFMPVVRDCRIASAVAPTVGILPTSGAPRVGTNVLGVSFRPEGVGPLPPPVRALRTVAGWLVRSVGEGALASAVWLTLGFPFLLSARRRSLAVLARRVS